MESLSIPNGLLHSRVKKVLGSLGMTQKEFAAEFGYTEQHVSYIIRGKRNLTVEAAQKISQKYPRFRFEWLLGYDDFETEHDKMAAAVGSLHNAYNHITALIELHGYSFSEIDLSHENEFVKTAYSSNAVEIRDGEGRSTMIPHSQWRRLISEIDRFIDFEMSGLFPQNR